MLCCAVSSLDTARLLTCCAVSSGVEGSSVSAQPAVVMCGGFCLGFREPKKQSGRIANLEQGELGQAGLLRFLWRRHLSCACVAGEMHSLVMQHCPAGATCCLCWAVCCHTTVVWRFEACLGSTGPSQLR